MNIVVFGEKGSGKTSIVRRITTGAYINVHVPTQEIEELNIDIEFEDTVKNYTFREVPEEQLERIQDPNLEASLYILMIDGSISRPESNVERYLNVLNEEQKRKTIILVSKCDLPFGFDINDNFTRVSTRTCYNIPEVTEILQRLEE